MASALSIMSPACATISRSALACRTARHASPVIKAPNTNIMARARLIRTSKFIVVARQSNRFGCLCTGVPAAKVVDRGLPAQLPGAAHEWIALVKAVRAVLTRRNHCGAWGVTSITARLRVCDRACGDSPCLHANTHFCRTADGAEKRTQVNPALKLRSAGWIDGLRLPSHSGAARLRQILLI